MILVIDNYDSFVYNVVAELQKITEESIVVVRNDETTCDTILQQKPSHIILSPGPKHPKESGVCLDVLKYITTIPTLGICLGHQALGYQYKSDICRLSVPVHGKSSMISKIQKTSKSNLAVKKREVIEKGLPETFEVMRYHSLYVDKLSDELCPLYETPDGIVMMMMHKVYPQYGVQFHPESYFSTYGSTLLKNFLTIS